MTQTPSLHPSRETSPPKGGTIEYGTGLCNDFAVVWRNVPNKINNNPQTFALYFSTVYPETSYITFVYGSITNDVPTSIGIEDPTGKQGEPVASMSSEKLVEFTDSLDNYYRITKIKVSMSKLTIGGVNDDKAIIWVQGWEESRPGGVNVILEDPSEGKYHVPQIVKTASFALGTAGLVTVMHILVSQTTYCQPRYLPMNFLQYREARQSVARSEMFC